VKTVSSKRGRYYYPLGSYSLLRTLSFERFSKYFRETPGGDLVLDYGAGDRPYEEMLRTKYSRYLAVDFATTHLSYYNGKMPDIFVTSGGTLPVDDMSVDCVVLTEVLEHIYDPREVLADLERVLKPGGRLLGTVPFAIQHHDEPFDFYRYTYYCLQRMFVDTGFEILNLDYVGDMVAVCASTSVSMFEIFPKGLDKLHLKLVGKGLRKLLHLPLFAYYYVAKVGLNPAKIGYFKRYPLGFSFCCLKPKRIS